MIDRDNPHREIFPHAVVVYWGGGGVACGKRDPWAYARVTTPGNDYPEATFWPRERPLMNNVIEHLAHAFELGRAAKAKEVRAVLDIEARP